MWFEDVMREQKLCNGWLGRLSWSRLAGVDDGDAMPHLGSLGLGVLHHSCGETFDMFFVLHID